MGQSRTKDLEEVPYYTVYLRHLWQFLARCSAVLY